jgi:hypothetical protein
MEQRTVLKLAGKLLEISAVVFSNRTCNDLPEGFFDGISQDEIDVIKKGFARYTDEPEAPWVWDCEKLENIIPDNWMMEFLAGKIREMP